MARNASSSPSPRLLSSCIRYLLFIFFSFLYRCCPRKDETKQPPVVQIGSKTRPTVEKTNVKTRRSARPPRKKRRHLAEARKRRDTNKL